MKNSVLKALIILLFFLSLTDLQGSSQDVITVSLRKKGNTQLYALMKSEEEENLWYYASLSPKLYEYRAHKNAPLMPALTLIRFQKIDPRDPNKLMQGALLECIFEVGDNKNVVKALQSKLPKNVDRKLARILPLPIQGFEMEITKPDGQGEILLEAQESNEFSSNPDIKLARFATILATGDAAILSALLNDKGGIAYKINFKYNQISQPKNIKVNLNLEEDRKKLDNLLIKQLTNRNKSPKILTQLKEVHTESSTNPSEPYDIRQVGQKKLNVSKGLTAQSHKDLAKIIEIIYKTREERVIAAKGILTLSNYSQEIINQKIYTEASYDEWKTAYLMLPNINSRLNLNIKDIILTIDLRDKKHSYEKTKVKWNENTGWRDKNDNSITIVKFALKDLQVKANKNALEAAYFKVDSTIRFFKDSDLSSTKNLQVLNGGMPINTPFTIFEPLAFDFINLFWDGLKSNLERLTKVEIAIKDDSRSIRRTVEPIKQADGRIIYPEMVYVGTQLNNYEQGKVRAHIYFHTANKKRIAWEFNGLKLFNYFENPYFMFFNEDWNPKEIN
jgi:hypothetical protein